MTPRNHSVEYKLSHLHTRVEGWVEKLVVKASGDVVTKGQKMFEIYSPSLVNAQEEYLNALKSNNQILISASPGQGMANEIIVLGLKGFGKF